MPRLTSTCFNCGAPKTDFVAEYCPNCTTLYDTTIAAFREKNPEAAQSDALYAARAALMERAHTAHKNYVDPRLHMRLGPRPEGLA